MDIKLGLVLLISFSTTFVLFNSNAVFGACMCKCTQDPVGTGCFMQAFLGWNQENVAGINLEDRIGLTLAQEACTKGNTYCKVGSAPSGIPSSANGQSCRIGLGYDCGFHCCCAKSSGGKWSSGLYSCVTCNGRKVDKICFDNSGIYGEATGSETSVCTKDGGGVFASTCGASTQCDGRKEGDSCGTNGRCDSSGTCVQVQCGGSGQPCCTTGNQCQQGFTCQNDVCINATDPCTEVGRCFPTTSCTSGTINSFCIDRSVYDENQNLFRSLTGDYRCGSNTCTIGCVNDNCCKTIRGNCYTTATNPTGCNGPSSANPDDIQDCTSAGGNTCAENQPQGATRIDEDPAYGPIRCWQTTTTTPPPTTPPPTTPPPTTPPPTTPPPACTEGTYRCNGNFLEQCVGGQWRYVTTCQFGCDSTTNPPQCKLQGCVEGSLQCSGSNLQKCVNGQWVTQQTCPNGCSNNQCVGLQPIFAVSCTSCEAGQQCSCSLSSSSTCNRGVWVLTNSQGNPLSQTLRFPIPPPTVNFVANDSGTIVVDATCADPTNLNSTTVVVTPKFLACPDSCKTNVECVCLITNCTAGTAYITNSEATPLPNMLYFPFTGNYAIKFTPTQGGKVDVRAICDNPYRSVRSTINITGPTTTTTPPISGTFTVTNFVCSQLSGTTGAYKCDAQFNNGLNENVVLVYLVSLKSTGAVKTANTFTLAQIQGQVPTQNYYCTVLGTGSYYVSWQAYRQSDSQQVNPIAWSTVSEAQPIICS